VEGDHGDKREDIGLHILPTRSQAVARIADRRPYCLTAD